MKLDVSAAVTPRGRVILRGYRAGAIEAARPYAAALMLRRDNLRRTEPGLFRRTIQDQIKRLSDKIAATFDEYALGIESATENLIMTGSLTGRDLLVQYLINGTTYTGGLNYGALGTGSTAPAAGDTQLTTESARATPSIANDLSNNQAQLQFYFPDANLANGTYREVGTFMNGTASANTGKLFNHALLGAAYTKTAGTDTTLEVDITLT